MNNFWLKWCIALAVTIAVGTVALVFLPAPVAAPTPATSATIGKPFSTNGAIITVLELLEDSRCPVDAQCIWAGRVRVRAVVSTADSDRGYVPREFTFVLGEAPQQDGQYSIALTGVTPAEKHAGVSVAPAEYGFTFSVKEEGGLGTHCGGFIQNAPTCGAGLHCQLKTSAPDTGGTCVQD